MKRARLTYAEGTWFEIPLNPRVRALGVVARKGTDRDVLAYFFGPFSLTSRVEFQCLEPKDAVVQMITTDLALRNGRWRILATSDVWDRNQWPVPAFGQQDALRPGLAWRLLYSDELEFVGREPISPEQATLLPRDGLAGFRACEVHLLQALIVPKPYHPGSCFEVARSEDSMVVGVVARCTTTHLILAYFFEIEVSAVGHDFWSTLRPGAAFEVRRVGDALLLEERWPIVGQLAPWVETDWPIPVFGRRDRRDRQKGWLVEFGPDLRTERTTQVNIQEISGLPESGAVGGLEIDTLFQERLVRTGP